jgi:hypothetical protein
MLCLRTYYVLPQHLRQGVANQSGLENVIHMMHQGKAYVSVDFVHKEYLTFCSRAPAQD